jgi:hypothetical protein
MMGVSGWKRGILALFFVLGLLLIFDSGNVSAQECNAHSGCPTGWHCIIEVDQIWGYCEEGSGPSGSTNPADYEITNFNANPVSSSRIDLNWDWRCRNPPSQGGCVVPFFEVLKEDIHLAWTYTSTSYSNTGLSACTRYNYRVRLRDWDNQGSNILDTSGIVVATTSGCVCPTHFQCGSPYCSGTYTRVTPTCNSGSCTNVDYDCRDMGDGYTCNSGVCEAPPFSSASCTVNGQSSGTVQVTPGSTVTFGLSADPTTGTCMLNYGDGTSNTGACVRTVYKSYSTPNTYNPTHSRITSPTVTASCPTINVRCPSPNQVWSQSASSCVDANAVHNPSSQSVTHPSNIGVQVTYAVNPTLRFHCWTENPDGTCTPGGTVSTFSNGQTLTNSNPGSRRLCTKAYYENFGGMIFWTNTYYLRDGTISS